MMKISFDLSHRRANVWLDEAPPAAYTASSVVTKVVKPKIAIELARRIACVEIALRPGPSSYALLGAELVEADVDGLEVVALINEVGIPFPVPLAKFEKANVGLLAEYADAAINGIARVAEAVGAPTRRKLWFGWAAHGIDSSSWVFERASGIVLQLLTLPNGLEDLEDRIRTLVVASVSFK